MAKYDLTSQLAPYLDRHLVFPLLEFLSAKKIYNENEILQTKLNILNKTNMVDYILEIRQQLNLTEDESEPINALQKKREHVLEQLQQLQSEAQVVIGIMNNEEASKSLDGMRDSKSITHFLQNEYGLKPEMMESLYKLGKFRYECGNYSVTSTLLYFYINVMPTTDKNYLNVLWGKLASEILLQQWDSALEELNRLRDFIDCNSFGSTLQVLTQRTWLIHWSLFVFFNHSKGRDLIIDMFLYKNNYLNAIQTMCPHILRYLATAVIINRPRRSALKDLVKVIQQESYTYKDPITEFLEHLYVNFDFESARLKLHECEIVLYNDFFLIACLEDFIENARLMIFETFCRIHQCISIQMLASKLNMEPDEAECWIVNLIRNARLDAKIDSKLGHVVMGAQPLSPYQQLLEKVDSLSVRSEALLTLIERKLKSRTQDIRWGAQDFAINA
ncbi:eukaryotic translation initiation factor 3 subunit E-like [Macrosteles quadrilineatus]|uniref:eukaryotic translation initiation factor 3 subunit E-like n=1 Tax=Macrosteles quadrilineatus TaxID=74068 RepID=UPI0023E2B657|nr:eukaryotic translation initiation factor 3 subunit E-like [Macrosteles quadrilineatus]